MTTLTLLNDTTAFEHIVAFDGGGFLVLKLGATNGLMLFEQTGATFAKVGGDIPLPTDSIDAIEALKGGGFVEYFTQVDEATSTCTVKAATFDDLGVQIALAEVAQGPAGDRFAFGNQTEITTGFAGSNEQHWFTTGVSDAGLGLVALSTNLGQPFGQTKVLDGWNAASIGDVNLSAGMDGGCVVGIALVGSAFQIFSDRVNGNAPGPTFAYVGQAYAGHSFVMAVGNSPLFETSTTTGSGASLNVIKTISIALPDDPNVRVINLSKPGQQVFNTYTEIEGFGIAVLAQYNDAVTREVTSVDLMYFDYQGHLCRTDTVPEFVRAAIAGFQFTVLDSAGNDDQLQVLLTWRQEVNGPGNGFSMLARVFEPPIFGIFQGTSESDFLHGFGRGDVLAGRAVDDLIQGFGGNDELTGLQGNDTLDGGDGNDDLLGGVGGDRVLVD